MPAPGIASSASPDAAMTFSAAAGAAAGSVSTTAPLTAVGTLPASASAVSTTAAASDTSHRSFAASSPAFGLERRGQRHGRQAGDIGSGRRQRYLIAVAALLRSWRRPHWRRGAQLRGC
eukprot:1638740-Pleurochrysis_carterae.AAC.1